MHDVFVLHMAFGTGDTAIALIADGKVELAHKLITGANEDIVKKMFPQFPGGNTVERALELFGKEVVADLGIFAGQLHAIENIEEGL